MSNLTTYFEAWISSINCCHWEGITCGSFSSARVIKLELSRKRLSEKLSDYLVGLDKLKTHNLSHDLLKGSLPVALFYMPNLEQLDLSYNDFSRPILRRLGTCSSLEQLLLGRNDLKEILDVFSQFQNFQFLVAHSNLFSGRIPSSLSNSPTISLLNLRNNTLEGLIDVNCSTMIALNSLRLGSNKNLTTLALTLNFCDETLPDLPNLHFEMLKTLVIVDCRLKGSIPLWFKLVGFIMEPFGWKIPPWLGSYRDLFYMDLSNNLLTGEILKSLTKLLGLIHGNISLEEPSPGFPFFLKRNCFPPILNLGHNFFSEPIWLEFRNLRILHVFDLKFNNFSRPILVNLSKMINLEILDLSHNNLSGTIPSSLQSLNFLSFFSFTYNQLYGRISYGVGLIILIALREKNLQQGGPQEKGA
ncbi:hypothetical protein CXB51_017672 [Gossypium anomalum]|uniref:Leucine-rich repeat-containing N-terminal plant-type domain-containing protein n=1 Tax=Gossypium anomalum TaxID=47600 RepID=A0A8J5YHJ1_9ROSI|nr:hypothetical protein CXB51_017672 [Gossypium anomalum]